ncbi:MAG: hypothetical protein ACJ8CB_15685 [Ktedonobacteraceae bacterium]
MKIFGDDLDALLCAVQAAWVYTQRDNGYGVPAQCERDEGWIVTVPPPLVAGRSFWGGFAVFDAH